MGRRRKEEGGRKEEENTKWIKEKKNLLFLGLGSVQEALRPVEVCRAGRRMRMESKEFFAL